MSIDRHYVIGVPLAVTIHPTGGVTFDVDLSEVGDIVEDEDAADRYSDHLMVLDSAIAEAVVARIGNYLTVTINPATGGNNV